MLVKFKVGNFASFGEIQEFSMYAGPNGAEKNRTFDNNSDNPVLRSSFVYGKNASGKTSFIRAMVYSRGKILGYGPTDSRISSDFKFKYDTDFTHRDNNGCKKQSDSYFEYQMKTECGLFSYGFEMSTSTNSVSSEWLVRIYDDHEEVIFERDVADFTTLPDGIIADVLDDTDRSQLALNNAFDYIERNESNRENSVETVIKSVYLWFQDCLIIRTNDSAEKGVIVKDKSLKCILGPITKFDTGIISYSIKELRPGAKERVVKARELNEFNISRMSPEESCLTILDKRMIKMKVKGGDTSYEEVMFAHDGYELMYRDESDGTKRLMQFLFLFSNDVRPNTETSSSGPIRTLVIDEIDRSMHTKMTHKIISDFIDDKNASNCQLIATTHESDVLPDLRQDEIWFIDKNEDGCSTLYSMEEYSKIDKEGRDDLYLEGRFGAIPKLLPVLYKDNDYRRDNQKLLSFSVSNYKSFSDRQTLSLRLDKKSNDCLNLAVIFGKNAAGKSNLLKAMADAKKIITAPEIRIWPPLFSKMVADNDKISTFEFEIFINGSVYRYILSVFTGEQCHEYGYSIVKEELFDISNQRNEILVFSNSHEPPSRPKKAEENEWDEYGELKTLERDLEIKKETLVKEKRNLEAEEFTLNNRLSEISSFLVFTPSDEKEKIMEELYRTDDDSIKNPYMSAIQSATFRKLYDPVRDSLAEKKDIEAKLKTIREMKKRWDKIIGETDEYLKDTRSKIKTFKENHDDQNMRNIYTESRLAQIINGEGERESRETITKCKDVFNWFSDVLTIIRPEDHLFAPRDNEYLDELSEIVKGFDIGIERIRFKKMDDDEKKRIEISLRDSERGRLKECYIHSQDDISMSFIAKNLSGLYRLSFWHGRMEMSKLVTNHSNEVESEFDFNDESDGTARLIEIAPILMEEDVAKIYLIDEMDRRMHPLLTRHIIEGYLSKQDENKQLIFTSHEHTLLNGLFYPEEFWTVECKNSRSTLEHNVKKIERCGMREDRAFTDGKLGGIPKFN